MSIKTISLGASANTTQTLNITGATNATPIEVTFTAGHNKVTGDRVAIAGVTGNTNANGIWTLTMTGLNTATLNGSVGNGTFGGTVRVAQVFDKTPHMKGHSAAFFILGNHVGVLDIEAYASYDDFAAGVNNSGAVPALARGANVTIVAGSSSAPAKNVLTTAATNAGLHMEMVLPYMLRILPTTATSGTFAAGVLA